MILEITCHKSNQITKSKNCPTLGSRSCCAIFGWGCMPTESDESSIRRTRGLRTAKFITACWTSTLISSSQGSLARSDLCFRSWVLTSAISSHSFATPWRSGMVAAIAVAFTKIWSPIFPRVIKKTSEPKQLVGMILCVFCCPNMPQYLYHCHSKKSSSFNLKEKQRLNKGYMS